MTANEQREFQKKYLLVLDQNALKCMRKEVVLDFRPVCSLVKMDHGFI
jgi:hypothetical protein